MLFSPTRSVSGARRAVCLSAKQRKFSMVTECMAATGRLWQKLTAGYLASSGGEGLWRERPRSSTARPRHGAAHAPVPRLCIREPCSSPRDAPAPRKVGCGKVVQVMVCIETHPPKEDTKSAHQGSTGRTLTLLGLFAILNTLFRDMHEMAKASAINEILPGHRNGNPVTDGALPAGAFGVEIPLLAMLLPSLPAPRLPDLQGERSAWGKTDLPRGFPIRLDSSKRVFSGKLEIFPCPRSAVWEALRDERSGNLLRSVGGVVQCFLGLSLALPTRVWHQEAFRERGRGVTPKHSPDRGPTVGDAAGPGWFPR